MSHSKRGFVQGRIGVKPSLGAIPISVASIPGTPNGCPAGFKDVFGTCQLDLAPGVVYTRPFVIMGRRR